MAESILTVTVFVMTDVMVYNPERLSLLWQYMPFKVSGLMVFGAR